jgi:hydroxymethylpyrimidine/phosphomethylpyrimidine kinase
MSAMATQRPVALVIGGSDSGGGAGIQADLQTLTAHGVFGTTAITATTAQNSRGVRSINALPADHVIEQIEAVLDDYPVSAVKIGMLATADIVRAVAATLRKYRARNIVLDPVIAASAGTTALLERNALKVLVAELIPMSTVVTPNLPEVEIMLGIHSNDSGAIANAGRRLLELGAQAAVIKGGHQRTEWITDHYFDAAQHLQFRHRRLPFEAHGTGCSLSSAIAAGLARGCDSAEATRSAVDYVNGAIRHAFRLGLGESATLDHHWSGRWR